MEEKNYSDGFMKYFFPDAKSDQSRTPLKNICAVYSLLEKRKIDKLFLDEDRLLAELSIYLGTTKQETVLFCIIFSLNYDSCESVGIAQIARVYGVSTVRMLQLNDVLLSLCNKRLCKMTKTRTSKSQIALKGTYFSVTKEVSQCIIQNKSIDASKKEPEDKNDMIEYLSKIYEIINLDIDILEDKDQLLSGSELVDEIMEAENDLNDSQQIKKIKLAIPNKTIRALFYFLCTAKINEDDENVDLVSCLKRIYEKSKICITEARKFMDKTHPLVTAGLVELNETNMISTATVTVTEDGMDLMFGDESDLFKKRMSVKDIIKPEDIHEKTLFYSQSTGEQINMLRSALEEPRFLKLRSQLKEKGLPCGIAALLYGGPGTGKTETVYQIAKKTGRSIVHVDIAETKSCWFGESEKIIRALFRKYKKLCKESVKDSSLMPILFLNEADGIISKRRSISTSGTVQTENAIQNIILEELETLEGILIATTNLEDNMDGAFARRFLFKINIDQPTPEARKSIWQDKIPSLSDGDALALARAYNFSGGEIDNIVRKIEIESIIRNNSVCYAEIEKLCQSEQLNSNTTCIGFQG